MLEVRGLEVRYGGIAAVKGIDFYVHAGELVALIGANGAGKTTTLKALMAWTPAAAGTVRFRGETVNGQPSYQLARAGMALVPEGRGVFARLSVAENLAMGAYARSDKVAISSDLDMVFSLLPRLAERRQQLAGTLSGGEQQMLAIGRALLGRPKLLLLDEPSMGLSPLLVQTVFEVIRKIAAEGVTILLVEQNARLALEVSQRGYVMDGGKLTLAASSQDLLGNDAVRRAYLGE
jgi:branched-chain amino acid transport system ATP-binding protein